MTLLEEGTEKKIEVVAIDEANLSMVDRLGLAYCRLISGEWDNILGPKPSDFDSLPRFSDNKRRLFFKPKKSPRSKHSLTWPAAQAIESIIGKANTSRCWWKFELLRTEAEWLRWYLTEGYSKNSSTE